MTPTSPDVAAWDSLQQETFARATPATQAAWPTSSRMSGVAIAAYLDSHRFGVFATARVDGRPHAVPVGYSRHGAGIWLPTMGGSVRARNVERQPWAVLVVSEGDGRDDSNPEGRHRLCSIEGVTELLTSPDAPAEIRPTATWASHWLRLEPRRVYTYDGTGE